MNNKGRVFKNINILAAKATAFIILPVIMILTAYMLTGCQSFHERGGTVTDGSPAGSDLSAINMFEEGAFEYPDNCAGCHMEIYEAWSKSKHAYSWEDHFYQPDYLTAGRETGGATDVFCGECHAPSARRTGQLPPPDGSLFDATSKRGVSCDFCHTVSEVVKPFNVKNISEPGAVKRGPRGDGESPYHEVKFSKIHTDPAFCGACHSVTHPESGIKVIDTYDDWKESPHAAKGIRCQDCHMTPGPGVEKNPGMSSPMGIERDHVATHFFPGGSVFFQEREGNEQQASLAREMLEAAAELEADAAVTPEGIDLLVRVKNTGAGHRIPTGVTYIRKIWLEITVTDGSGREIFRSGHISDGNHVDPETVFYRKIFKDREGNPTPKSWIAHGIAYDRRIPPGGYDEQRFPVQAVSKGEHKITARLLYRSMSQEAADGLGIEGINVPSIEMARIETSINR